MLNVGIGLVDGVKDVWGSIFSGVIDVVNSILSGVKDVVNMFLVLFIKLVLIFDRDLLIWLVNRWFRFFVVDFKEVLMLEVRDVSLLLKFLRLFIDE